MMLESGLEPNKMTSKRTKYSEMNTRKKHENSTHVWITAQIRCFSAPC